MHDPAVHWEGSAEQGELFGALAKAQGQFGGLKRNRTVEVRTQKGYTYPFRYATLDAILDHVRKPLSENGLTVMQLINGSHIPFMMRTILGHESGQWIACVSPILTAGGDNQEFGSGVTYARRYSLNCVLGLAGEEDDDANRVDGNHYMDKGAVQENKARKGKGTAKKEPDAVVEKPSPGPLAEVSQIAERIGIQKPELRAYVKQRFKVDPEDLTMVQKQTLVATLRAVKDVEDWLVEVDRWREFDKGPDSEEEAPAEEPKGNGRLIDEEESG